MVYIVLVSRIARTVRDTVSKQQDYFRINLSSVNQETGQRVNKETYADLHHWQVPPWSRQVS